ncbi:MAG: long-chain fatty acid--CoA ligase [Firmicutes bacterium]|nr:long-chain fatty acid--CoA ligase [Bacillota bacterium]
MIETIQDLVESFKTRKSLCLSGGTNFTYREAYEYITTLSKGLLASGLNSGDRVLLISKNRPEWMLVSLALSYAGLIDVPRGEKASEGELNYIIKHSMPKIVIADTQKQAERVGEFRNIVTIDPVEGYTWLDEILEKGRRSSKKIPSVNPDTIASHLYTSGTTGEPKGAELSHGNFISNTLAASRSIKVFSHDTYLSVLPLWHVFERLVEYLILYSYGSIYYSSISTFANDLKSIQPTITALVPRILEKIFDKRVAEKVAEKSQVQRSIFKVFVGMSAQSRTSNLNPLHWLGILPRNYMEKQVFSKLREGFGGNMRIIVSGGGKLRQDIDKFFYAAGMPIIEGYGLTETSPVIAVRTFENWKLGTVGPPLDNLEVKIVDSETGIEKRKGKTGVIYVKGPSVMRGYYKNAYETKRALNDGWFDTGDLGFIDSRGNLTITGRKKNIIVLSNGENISPEPIEETLKKCPVIANAIIIGQDWKGLGALIEPDFENVEKLIPGYDGRLDNPEVLKYFKRQIRDLVNPLTCFREFECIKAFRLLRKNLEAGRELTETLKVKKAVIEKSFSREIESLSQEINGKK